MVELEEACVFRLENGSLWLELQSGTRWSGLWRLPRIAAVPEKVPIWQEQYGFTHHRVCLKVFEDGIFEVGKNATQIPVSRIAEVPMAAADARVVRRLLKTKTG
jgi:A/G-specific adenine glycosylase